MKKKIILISVLTILLAGGIYYVWKIVSSQQHLIGGDKDIGGCLTGAGYSWCPLKTKCVRVWEEPCKIRDVLNTSFNIDGTIYLLTNGTYEKEIVPGSASKTTIRIFGVPVQSDLNNDGVNDYAMFLEKSDGGSGTFYYVAAAIKNKTNNDVSGTNAILLGDRIAPQTVEVQNGTVIANYADRLPGQPMTTKPSQGVSKYLNIENNILTETVKITQNPAKSIYANKTGCEQNKGVWYPTENICEINSLSESACTAKGGIFNQCASACRHDPTAQVCNMMCALTCTFK